jgi:hypothetical protein
MFLLFRRLRQEASYTAYSAFSLDCVHLVLMKSISDLVSIDLMVRL